MASHNNFQNQKIAMHENIEYITELTAWSHEWYLRLMRVKQFPLFQADP